MSANRGLRAKIMAGLLALAVPAVGLIGAVVAAERPDGRERGSRRWPGDGLIHRTCL
jgi:hypothetical protein